VCCLMLGSLVCRKGGWCCFYWRICSYWEGGNGRMRNGSQRGKFCRASVREKWIK